MQCSPPGSTVNQRRLARGWRLRDQLVESSSDEYRVTDLPATAHPAVLSADQVRLPADDRVRLDASIGELAPEGQ